MHKTISKIFGLTGLIIALFVVTALASTNIHLEASHRVLSSVDNGKGLNTITLEITLSNPTSTDLTAINLSLMPGNTLMVVDNPVLAVDKLYAGSSITVNWTINSPMPADMLGSGLPIMLRGQATDGYGGPVAVSVISN